MSPYPVRQLVLCQIEIPGVDQKRNGAPRLRCIGSARVRGRRAADPAEQPPNRRFASWTRLPESPSPRAIRAAASRIVPASQSGRASLEPRSPVYDTGAFLDPHKSVGRHFGD